MKREVSGIPLSPSKTILVTPIIRHGEVTGTLVGDNLKILKIIFQTHLTGSNPTVQSQTVLSTTNLKAVNNQSNLEGLVSDFMASQDARLSKFEPDFKQQQSELTNKIDIVLKAITDRIADPQCSTQTHGSINAITIHTKQQNVSYDDGEKENKEEEDNPKNIHVNPPIPPDPSVTFITKKVLKFNSFFESLRLVPPSSNTELIYTKEEDGDVMFIKIISKDDNSRKEDQKQESKKWSILTYSRLGVSSHITSTLCVAQSPQYFYKTPSLWKDSHRTSRYHATLGMCM
ncbi:hypothetical protein Tco_0853465 [Tanacetum coccineum]